MTTVVTAAPFRYDKPTRERTWEDENFHNVRRDESLAVKPATRYDGGLVLHTVWRSDTPKGVLAMQVAIAEAIKVARKREPKVNPFDAHIVSWNDGETRRVTLEDGDVLSTVVGNLRRAAKSIDRSVVIAFDTTDADAKKVAKTFRFMLKAKVAKKGTATATPEAVTIPATPAPSATTSKATNAKKK